MPLKMVYLALLMATCSFALPVLNKGNEILNDMIIETKLRNIEIKLMTLAADIEGINTDLTEVIKEAITTYRNIKSTLSEARYKPKQLANKTIQTTNDLILYMEAWDKNYNSATEEQKEYIKKQTPILGQLVNRILKESKSVLRQAKTKYRTAYYEMHDMEIKLSTLKRLVSAEFDSDSWIPYTIASLWSIRRCNCWNNHCRHFRLLRFVFNHWKLCCFQCCCSGNQTNR